METLYTHRIRVSRFNTLTLHEDCNPVLLCRIVNFVSRWTHGQAQAYTHSNTTVAPMNTPPLPVSLPPLPLITRSHSLFLSLSLISLFL